jgi:DNA-binding response OmpR family regulator
MKRVVLIHWKPAEAQAKAAMLRTLGYRVELAASGGGPELRTFGSDPPAAFVIDLSRSPSQGRDVGEYLRRRKSTRNVPLVFAGGEPDKVERAKTILPDAAFTTWEKIADALEQSLASPPAALVVPKGLAGYSGTPLVKKLRIGKGTRVALLDAPDGFESKLEPLPDGAKVIRSARMSADIVLLFVRSKDGLKRRFEAAAGCLAPGGGLWIVWPKKASGLQTDLGEPEVRKFGLAASFVDYKICAVDETWSGLLFARRTGA